MKPDDKLTVVGPVVVLRFVGNAKARVREVDAAQGPSAVAAAWYDDVPNLTTLVVRVPSHACANVERAKEAACLYARERYQLEAVAGCFVREEVTVVKVNPAQN